MARGPREERVLTGKLDDGALASGPRRDVRLVTIEVREHAQAPLPERGPRAAGAGAAALARPGPGVDLRSA
jgi:hypothetical protein